MGATFSSASRRGPDVGATFSSIEIIQARNSAEKLIELESSLAKPIFLLKNTEFPFFDTTHSNNIFNSISLINLNGNGNR